MFLRSRIGVPEDADEKETLKCTFPQTAHRPTIRVLI